MDEKSLKDALSSFGDVTQGNFHSFFYVFEVISHSLFINKTITTVV